MPVGPSVWDGTAVRLPTGGPSELLNVLTGEVVAVRNGVFAVVEAMGSLPLAVLVGDA